MIEIYRHMNCVFEQERDEAVSELQMALNKAKLIEERLTSIQVCALALITLYGPHVPSCSEG